MEINYYREPNAQGCDESWQACQFTCDTDLSAFNSINLVTINGQPYLRQHHVTYLTGKESCRAHHFAKHLAVQLLSGNINEDTGTVPRAMTPVMAPGDADASSPSNPTCRVLWIDTLNSPYIGAAIFLELAQHAGSKKDLHYLCLDVLGGQRDDHWWLNRHIEHLIKNLKPKLVVIDDIDHFMPYCGVRLANEFNRVIRDCVNHMDTAFLFIGYNHTGKKACTAGELGKHLFSSANDIFSLSTVREITTVRHICGYDLRVNPGDSQFLFTIGPDNLPQEAVKPGAKPATGIDDETLREIVEDIIRVEGQDPASPGNITPEDLLGKVRARHREIKQQSRDTALLEQIHRLHLLPQEQESQPQVSATPSPSGSPCHDSAEASVSSVPPSLSGSLCHDSAEASIESVPSLEPCQGSAAHCAVPPVESAPYGTLSRQPISAAPTTPGN
ncbi:MAG: hypothetical protein IKW85_10545 [Muribaculaceae bacterium]|nr:hypothetical protein [Muribaculaceae bacterium]